MSAEIKIENVSIDSLKHDDRNARKHSLRNIAAIATSLKTFGQQRPLVVWQDMVIAGNGTLMAAKELGWTEVLIHRVPDEWNKTKARAYAIADNRTSDLASWNDERLLGALKNIKSEEYLLAAGWNRDEIDDLLITLEEQEMSNLNVTDEKALDRYLAAAVRAFVFILPNEAYVWVVDNLEKIMREKNLANNVETIIALVEERFNEKAPAL